MAESLIKKINLRAANDKPLTITADEIPNTIPQKALNKWQLGDDEPYYKIQEIEYPLLANGYNYLESFFKSFIKKLERAPIPGSKDGHEMSLGKRGETDFIMSGALIKPNGDGTGKVYFKNYVPKEGNERFIKENETNMVEFSLVSGTRDERQENGDNTICQT